MILSLIATIAKFAAGLVDLIQSLVNQAHDDKEVQQGRLQQQAVEQTQKATDEAIANKVDALPVPTDKHRILDGM